MSQILSGVCYLLPPSGTPGGAPQVDLLPANPTLKVGFPRNFTLEKVWYRGDVQPFPVKDRQKEGENRR